MVGTIAVPQVTELLISHRGGNVAALGELLPLVYEELHRIARNYLRHERPGHTLQPTALVNEAYLRLIEQHECNWENRAHFFGIAASLMRRILLDYARRRLAQRRGGSQAKISLDEGLLVSQDHFSDLVALDEILDLLAHIDAQQARIAELHLFAGLTMKEIGEVLGCEERMVQQEWRMAKAWLHSTLAAK